MTEQHLHLAAQEQQPTQLGGEVVGQRIHRLMMPKEVTPKEDRAGEPPQWIVRYELSVPAPRVCRLAGRVEQSTIPAKSNASRGCRRARGVAGGHCRCSGPDWSGD